MQDGLKRVFGLYREAICWKICGYPISVHANFRRQFMHEIAPYTFYTYPTAQHSQRRTLVPSALSSNNMPNTGGVKISLEIAGKVCWIKNNPYLCCRNIDLVQTKIRHPSLSGCLFFFKNLNRGEVLKQGANSSFTHYYSLYEKKNLLPVCSHLH